MFFRFFKIKEKFYYRFGILYYILGFYYRGGFFREDNIFSYFDRRLYRGNMGGVRWVLKGMDGYGGLVL